MAGLLAALRGALVRAARCRAPVAAARWRPSLTLRHGVALALLGLASAAHAQWPFGNLFRRSSQAKVVSTSPHPAIARITVQEKNAVSYGSGSLIDARGQFGLVITNWHVVRDATGEINVEFPGGFRSLAKLLKVDADWDLAALEINRPPTTPLAISAALPQIGQPLVIAGYGAGDYRAAAGKCQQYLAPKEGMDFHMVEIDVEARQGDSGGPILNERGEIAGVLFGAASGFTAGSSGGRVLDFLASVVPNGRPGSDQPPAMANPNSLAQSSPPLLSPTAEHVLRSDPFSALAPQVEDQLRAMTQPPTTGARVPRNVLAAPPSDRNTELALVPLPTRRSAVMLAPPDAAPPSRLKLADQSITPLPSSPLASIAPPEENSPPSLAEITPAEGPPAPSLSPRKGAAEAKATSLNEASADQLLAAAWKQIGGTTLVEQIKTVLAAFGVLGILVVGWRFMSREEREDESE